MSHLKLPIGIQSFTEIRTGGYVYIDKTPLIHSLVQSGKYYFLSRPRRFGKSLLIDTFDAAFSQKPDLFSGLFLDSPDSKWDWNKRNPVLRIDWSLSSPRTPAELKTQIHELISAWARTWNFEPFETSFGGRFSSLIRDIHTKTGEQIVILVDEYDKPILDTLEDPVRAADMRDILRDFYGVIKPLDSHIRFVFITGVSKFIKTGIFSGLNNLRDITLDFRYSTICGYTEEDIRTSFAFWYEQYDPDLNRDWYIGYSWTGKSVYNPFDILLFFDSGIFRPYWFETGTPSFLLKNWLNEPRLPAEYDGMISGDEILLSFNPEKITVETLLFQTGYLTIRSWSSDGIRGFRCTLGYPNKEVRTSLNLLFSEALSGYSLSDNRDILFSILELGDEEGLHAHLQSFFASIPHDWYRRNPLARFEGYWASLMYSYLASLGFEVIPEDTTNKGWIDLTVKTPSYIWIFEFKVKGIGQKGKKDPLDQIDERGYAEKYLSDPRQKIMVGILFGLETRNIESWTVG